MYNDHQGKRWNVYGAKKGPELLSETQVLDLIKIFFVEQKDVFSWQSIEKVSQQKEQKSK